MKVNLNEYQKSIIDSTSYEDLIKNPRLILNNYQKLDFNRIKALIIRDYLKEKGICNEIDVIVNIMDENINKYVDSKIKEVKLEILKSLHIVLKEDFNVDTSMFNMDKDVFEIHLENLKIDLKNKEHKIKSRMSPNEKNVEILLFCIEQFYLYYKEYKSLINEAREIDDDYAYKPFEIKEIGRIISEYNILGSSTIYTIGDSEIKRIKEFNDYTELMEMFSLALSNFKTNISFKINEYENILDSYITSRGIKSALSIFSRSKMEKLYEINMKLIKLLESCSKLEHESFRFLISAEQFNKYNFESKQSFLQYKNLTEILINIGYCYDEINTIQYIEDSIESIETYMPHIFN